MLSVLRIARTLAVSFVLSSSLACAAPMTLDVEIDFTLYGHLDQVWVCGTGGAGCGPAAAVNSLVYLQNRFPQVYDASLVPRQSQDLNGDGVADAYDDMIAVGRLLAGSGYMSSADGTTHDEFIDGKMSYMEQVAPGRTKYAAQDPLDWTNPFRPRPGFVEARYPTWQFLYEQLRKERDVEVLVSAPGGNAHWVTVRGFHWTDANQDHVIQAGEASIDYIDPASPDADLSTGVWHDTFEGNTALFTGVLADGFLRVAVSQGVPAPSSLLLLGAGLAALCGGRRARQTRGLERSWGMRLA